MSSVLSYKVTSDRKRTVTGIGVFKAGETKTLSQNEADDFQRVVGLSLNQGNVPQGVTVEIHVTRGTENREG